MDTIAQRIAMAELHGYTAIHYEGDVFTAEWTWARGTRVPVPNYLHDLNAVHEVETFVVRSLHDDDTYAGLLCQLSAPRNQQWSPLRAMACADAATRVRALLMVRGLWKQTVYP